MAIQSGSSSTIEANGIISLSNLPLTPSSSDSAKSAASWEAIQAVGRKSGLDEEDEVEDDDLEDDDEDDDLVDDKDEEDLEDDEDDEDDLEDDEDEDDLEEDDDEDEDEEEEEEEEEE